MDVVQQVDGAKRAPRYEVDLDAAPEHRWRIIIQDYLPHILQVDELIQADVKRALGPLVGTFAESLVTTLLGFISKLGFVMFGEELKAVAEQTGLSVGRLVLLQLAYEASTCCTSIVAPGVGGIPIHGRTMDWEMEYLKPLTIEVDFKRGGVILFSATTWAGYVGILTGMKPNAFSVSVNYRNCGTGTIWTNIKNSIRGAWPVSFLVRQVLQDAKTYDTAVTNLRHSELMAPVYFTVCGTHPGQGMLLTRDRSCSEQDWDLKDKGPIVQTNIEHWSNSKDSDILHSIARRRTGQNGISQYGSPELSRDRLWSLLRTQPIRNSVTLYTSIMLPASGIIESWTEEDQVVDGDIPRVSLLGK